MVAEAFSRCGVFVGERDGLLPPSPNNERGHWELAAFVDLNDELLARLGGAWDVLPELRSGWERKPELEELRTRALELVAALAGREPWAWKDPRNSVTLPFWRTVVPDLRIVVCVRHPVEVAESLTKRGSSSRRFGLDLWLAYNRRLLADSSSGERVVTHYSAYFHDARAELERIRDALGLTASDEELAEAGSATVAGSLRHHRVRMEELAPDVARTYAELCLEAGPRGGGRGALASARAADGREARADRGSRAPRAAGAEACRSRRGAPGRARTEPRPALHGATSRRIRRLAAEARLAPDETAERAQG